MNFLNRPEYVKEQYKDSKNLNARIALHARFSCNPQGWMRWVFEQIDLPDGGRVLELGCGPGTLWGENLQRIPAGLRLTLSDYSHGMAATARKALQEKLSGAAYAAIDAAQLPFSQAGFDAVIANHMLYHVPNRQRAFAEIHRVLRPGGRLYATTCGNTNMREMDELARRFDPTLDDYSPQLIEFTLENGSEQLAPWFREVQLRRYPDGLEVTEAAPLVAFLASGTRAPILAGQLAELEALIDAEIQANGGVLHITKDAGIFIAEKRDE